MKENLPRGRRSKSVDFSGIVEYAEVPRYKRASKCKLHKMSGLEKVWRCYVIELFVEINTTLGRHTHGAERVQIEGDARPLGLAQEYTILPSREQNGVWGTWGSLQGKWQLMWSNTYERKLQTAIRFFI